MVSFSCEACGDVIAKKKLDNHKYQCRGASFSCIDCNTHFPGAEYRTHTSCISEAQRYQGALYKEPKKKGKQHKQQQQQQDQARDEANSQSLVPRSAYVEDAPDADTGAIAIVDAPPHAPSPPPAVNVFDFLVGGEDTPQPARHPDEGYRKAYDEAELYARTGFSYGDSPVEPSFQRYESMISLPDTVPIDNYRTPAPKRDRESRKAPTADKKSTDKKRKRAPVEELDMNLIQARQADEIMTDAPPILHSGLTGGLNRLLAPRPDFPPSPDYSGGDVAEASPLSPMKRSKHARPEKTRGRELDREPLKAIEYHHNNRHGRSGSRSPARSRSPSEDRNGLQLVRKRTNTTASGRAGDNPQPGSISSRASLFMSFINKGPDSERGLSVNKALKRYHRERLERWEDELGKGEEEKELWKLLRLRKNERGEIVLFV
ncbi:hypothetical protein M501DRAFT_944962 [Patellaria atrata CBS 101060]|uniref:Zinc finger C2H2 LYAR-type domain-containing protein n=1 Tax=Patellaria atrata CBS 101060 TaxID=1346257 RepID=A0A9P4VN27_9PEZI|nr:hypothetical protein M501DRAFT_944962 [Patellaria atrata CBS 101060]